jgi:pimeloyl-ACP methyl ester carboxylesterase
VLFVTSWFTAFRLTNEWSSVMQRQLCVLLFVVGAVPVIGSAADTIPPIPRVLPPEGLEIPADVRTRLETRLAATKRRVDGVNDDKLKPDVEVFTKAVELALIHREFYVERDFAKADWALNEADKRLDSLAKGETPWTTATGTVVEGYRSSIDGSAQPYGLVIPKDHDFTKACPLYVWLHGRGDKNTDIHFLQERATRPGQITPANAIVVHPFGRHCVGWKHAGEIDVLEVVESVKQRYKIDPARVVLIGFSMGGAGAWHIGAHYADHWVAVSPGAGFVDVARYQRITPDRMPEWYVQKLWGLYDVPDYVRNLFNTTTIAYSGELDAQRAAAVIMEEAFQAEGRELAHLIGPGVAHAYEPNTLKELMKRLDEVVAAVDPKTAHYSDNVFLQTRTLRYNWQKWIEVDGLEEHWKDARIDAERKDEEIVLKTVNVNRLSVTAPPSWSKLKLLIDGQQLGPFYSPPASPKLSSPALGVKATVIKEGDDDRGSPVGRFFAKSDGQWKPANSDSPFHERRRLEQKPDGSLPKLSLRKRPQGQGPIDDAFMSAFVVVMPTGKSRNSAFQAWCDAELEHFKDRWRALMRGEARVIADRDLTADEMRGPNLILWGDPDSNSVIRDLMKAERLPVQFVNGQWRLGETAFDGNHFVPQLIYPNLEGFGGYFVLNSGLTFREGHDRTNSQQNPKLPDWVIVDITQPPDAFTPGRIHDADFFDEQWKLKRQPKAP